MHECENSLLMTANQSSNFLPKALAKRQIIRCVVRKNPSKPTVTLKGLTAHSVSIASAFLKNNILILTPTRQFLALWTQRNNRWRKDQVLVWRWQEIRWVFYIAHSGNIEWRSCTLLKFCSQSLPAFIRWGLFSITYQRRKYSRGKKHICLSSRKTGFLHHLDFWLLEKLSRVKSVSVVQIPSVREKLAYCTRTAGAAVAVEMTSSLFRGTKLYEWAWIGSSTSLPPTPYSYVLNAVFCQAGAPTATVLTYIGDEQECVSDIVPSPIADSLYTPTSRPSFSRLHWESDNGWFGNEFCVGHSDLFLEGPSFVTFIGIRTKAWD